MLMLISLLGGMLLAQGPSQATVISAADIDATMKESVSKNTLDKKVRETPVKGGIVRVGIVHRTSAEARALMHDELTEIYQIIEGSGTLLMGGTIEDKRPVSDPPNLGPTPSYFVTQVGGTTQKVGPRDLVIMPAGVPHRFTQLDGPISYVIYRFEPVPQK
jgi:mannose-6-phosphate isomerase-like protein (cupin superfamily)